ncbi:MAG: HsdR family type I site-specific deoxyribonuclease [Candidatus Poribacteria bacterium]|nr:HsdR family type I site-specific deoxyribonuclease [Candidatus Poribacteria bacterium]MDE0502537.1 HsdR family type I site-specific deoxyribonuclease [Candidatus Poribacteria bacterium]
MNTVGQQEFFTQRRVLAFFVSVLGYEGLGNWKDRPGNSNVEAEYLTNWLESQGHRAQIIERTLFEVRKAAAVGGNRKLYDANREVYGLLRYGVKIQPEAGERHQTVWLIDWKNPTNNHFGIAEEVTVVAENTKRPDIVLYVNGIALGVVELKRSTVSVSEGIRQNLGNQRSGFIRHFFSTVQLIMAGNESEGLRYGVIETPEKHWLRWKESDDIEDGNPLLRELRQVCNKERILELLHDFIVFDAGTKKICRHNQYFGVKSAQARVKKREGGIIWHTQGSGKSLTMVWLAKWIRENIPPSRVLIITDRTELDEQIEKVFTGVNEDIYRTRSGADLVGALNDTTKWLICSLIHKFGASGEISDRDVEEFIEEIKQNLPEDFQPRGEFFVFVDECHRTQSGKLHRAMKAILPEAMLIGFTGTPLLKRDKPQSIQTFGPYIHTYKYDEAVEDEVVLDLRYEARDIDQLITSQERIDEWFEIKTRGLTDLAKAQLRQRWGTMQRVLSSRGRLNQIVDDILMDMERFDRLADNRGNALLVSDSIYAACRLFEMFQGSPLQGKCAIVTSYRPSPSAITGEETGEGSTEKLLQFDIYRRMLAEHFNESEDTAMHKVEQFEQQVKKRFVEEPGQMKLLIVVDKLLTGFDAPPATYLYIDKKMQDHGLFQAICRVNRLHGEDKDYGYIIDYKDLFRSLEKSIADYTGEAFADYDTEDVQGLLENRLDKGRERLEEAREAVKALCEPVEPPPNTESYLRFFCAEESGNADQLKANEQKRLTLYKSVAGLLRAYANLANEMSDAGYSDAEAQEIKDEVGHYENVRQEVKLASGDYIDLKVYEPAMRHLLDTYIRAEESETLSEFDDLTLVELIVQRGEDAVNALPDGIRRSERAAAEAIEHNVRRLIIDRTPVNPRYYEQMSVLLDDLIRERRQGAIEYRAYLNKIVALARRIEGQTDTPYPPRINTGALRSIFDNINLIGDSEIAESGGQNESPRNREIREQMAVALDEAILNSREDDWRGHTIKERKVRLAMARVIAEEFGDYAVDVDPLFEIVKNQGEYQN